MHPPYKMVLVSLISLSFYLLLLLIIKFLFPKKKIPPYLILLGFSILPVISIFRQGSYESGDLNIHVTRTVVFYKALKEGVIIPRWAADLNATYGYPLFNFYYPLPYYISSFFHFLGFNFLNSVKLLLITTYISSGFFMYLWLKKHVAQKYALLGSIFYLYAPYHLVDMHFRATIGEMTSFSILPLILYFIDKSITKEKPPWNILAGISFGLLITAHAGIAVIGYGLISLYILSRLEKPNIIKGIKTFSPLFLGFAYSSFYWIPAMFESKHAHQKIGELILKFPTFSELLYSKWRYGFLFQGPRGELSFLIGYAHWIVIIISLILIFSKKVKNKNILTFTLLTTVYIFLILNISKPVWTNISMLKKMLLTYRLLVVISLITSALAAFVTNYLKSNKIYYLLISLAVLTTILNWGNRKNTPEIKDHQIIQNLPLSTINGEGAWNAVSITRPADKLWQDKVPANHIEAIKGDLVILEEERSTTSHDYLVKMQSTDIVKENTYYFPGWELTIDGKKEQINHSNRLYPGIVTFNLDKGIHKVQLTFKDTPIRAYSFYLTSFSLIASGFYLLFNSQISSQQKF